MGLLDALNQVKKENYDPKKDDFNSGFTQSALVIHGRCRIMEKWFLILVVSTAFSLLKELTQMILILFFGNGSQRNTSNETQSMSLDRQTRVNRAFSQD